MSKHITGKFWYMNEAGCECEARICDSRLETRVVQDDCVFCKSLNSVTRQAEFIGRAVLEGRYKACDEIEEDPDSVIEFSAQKPGFSVIEYRYNITRDTLESRLPGCSDWSPDEAMREAVVRGFVQALKDKGILL